ncbi:MAG: hypothetical protein M3323_12165 [Actinomycetota bacterium]|nr:hypothetical protein [Actinomycetota bacterium]
MRTGRLFLVLTLAAAPACTPVRHSTEREPANPLRAAVEITAAAGSARVIMTVRTESTSRRKLATIGMTTGVVDWDEGTGSVKQVTRFVPVPDGVEQPPPVWTVWDDDFLYRKGERVTENVPGHPVWVRLSFLELPPPAATPLGEDPGRAIDYLHGATSRFEEIGRQIVRGVEAVRYEAELDVEKMERLAPDPDVVDQGVEYFEVLGYDETVPADIWLDEEGRMIRFRVAAVLDDTRETFTIDLFDFGVDAAIELPQRAKAVSIYDLLP